MTARALGADGHAGAGAGGALARAARGRRATPHPPKGRDVLQYRVGTENFEFFGDSPPVFATVDNHIPVRGLA